MRLTRMHFEMVAEAVSAASESETRVAYEEPAPEKFFADKTMTKGQAYDEGFRDGVRQTIAQVVGCLASRLAKTNENFDRDKFRDACLGRTYRYESLRKLNESADRINRERELKARLLDAE